MSDVSIKHVLGGGVLIWIVSQVLGIILGSILGVSNLTIILGLILSFAIAFFIAKITLSGLNKKAFFNGFLQGITTAGIMIFLVSFLGGFVNYPSLLLTILGSSSGGFIVSKKK